MSCVENLSPGLVLLEAGRSRISRFSLILSCCGHSLLRALWVSVTGTDRGRHRQESIASCGCNIFGSYSIQSSIQESNANVHRFFQCWHWLIRTTSAECCCSKYHSFRWVQKHTSTVLFQRSKLSSKAMLIMRCLVPRPVVNITTIMEITNVLVDSVRYVARFSPDRRSFGICD